MSIAEGSSALPVLIPLLVAAGGGALFVGIFSGAATLMGRPPSVYLAFAALSFCGAGLMFGMAAYYNAGSVMDAATALRWQVACAMLYFPPLFVFIARYTGQRRLMPWLGIVVALSLFFLAININSPYSLSFSTLETAPPLHLAWGETLPHYVGEVSVWDPLWRGFFYSLTAWASWRAVSQFRRGERRAAVFLGTYLAILIACTTWGMLVDYDLLDSFYIVGLAYFSQTLLLSISMELERVDQNLATQRAYEELEASAQLIRRGEERFRLAMDALEEGLWELSIRNWKVTYSSGWARLLGYAPNDVAGRQDFWESHVHPEDKVRVQEALRAHIKGQAPAYREEYRLRAADGSWKWVLSSGRVVERAADGTAFRAVGTTIDITPLKKAQTEILRVNASLEETVQKRTAELTNAMRELDTFSYSVSHDLRAPLRAVLGFAQVLRDDHGQRLDPDARDLLGRIVQAGNRMNELVDGLLALARLRSQDMRLIAVDLSGLATATVGELRDETPGRQVEVKVAAGLVARADPAMIRSLIQNLVGNAWKYTGGKPSARIDIGSFVRAGERVFYVRDSGAGFDFRYADKLFQPFARLHTEQEFPGTGIGLATAHRIVERHGGSIWAEGKVGAGATFYFTLEGKAATQANRASNR